jgi:hypothetical protein
VPIRRPEATPGQVVVLRPVKAAVIRPNRSYRTRRIRGSGAYDTRAPNPLLGRREIAAHVQRAMEDAKDLDVSRGRDQVGDPIVSVEQHANLRASR